MAVARLLVVLSLCIAACSLVNAKPTIYVKNENDKLEPVLVPISSTVIPLPVYKVSYGVGVLGPKEPLPGKPSGDYKLITVSKKKGGGKVAASSVRLSQKKDDNKNQKETL